MSDGNGGANYAVTFVNDTTGVITGRAITVTAATDTKGYDAHHELRQRVPTITAGTLAGGDTGSFTQTFDTANVGTGKTLTPSGLGERRQRWRQLRRSPSSTTPPVSSPPRRSPSRAATDTKTYDGTTSSRRSRRSPAARFAGA